jgi:hypothetical protein
MRSFTTTNRWDVAKLAGVDEEHPINEFRASVVRAAKASTASREESLRRDFRER